MVIDSKGRLFGKISIIDVLIILALIAVAAGAGYKFTRSQTASPFPAKQDRIQIVFYQEEINDFTAKAVKKGDPARDGLQKVNFGEVTDIKIDESVSWGKTDKGKFVITSKPGYSSIYITMEGNGTVGSNGVAIGSSVYYVGQTITLHAGNAIFYGKIFDLKKVPEA